MVLVSLLAGLSPLVALTLWALYRPAQPCHQAARNARRGTDRTPRSHRC